MYIFFSHSGYFVTKITLIRMKFHNKKIEKINIFFLLGISTGFVHLLQKKNVLNIQNCFRRKKESQIPFYNLTIFLFIFERRGYLKTRTY